MGLKRILFERLLNKLFGGYEYSEPITPNFYFSTVLQDGRVFDVRRFTRHRWRKKFPKFRRVHTIYHVILRHPPVGGNMLILYPKDVRDKSGKIIRNPNTDDLIAQWDLHVEEEQCLRPSESS